MKCPQNDHNRSFGGFSKIFPFFGGHIKHKTGKKLADMAVRAGSPVISTLMMQEGAGPSARVRWVAAGIKPRVPHFRSAADTPLPPPDPGHQQCIMVHDHSCHIVILSHSHCVMRSFFHNQGGIQSACLVTQAACHTAIL